MTFIEISIDYHQFSNINPQLGTQIVLYKFFSWIRKLFFNPWWSHSISIVIVTEEIWRRRDHKPKLEVKNRVMISIQNQKSIIVVSNSTILLLFSISKDLKFFLTLAIFTINHVVIFQKFCCHDICFLSFCSNSCIVVDLRLIDSQTCIVLCRCVLNWSYEFYAYDHYYHVSFHSCVQFWFILFHFTAIFAQLELYLGHKIILFTSHNFSAYSIVPSSSASYISLSRSGKLWIATLLDSGHSLKCDTKFELLFLTLPKKLVVIHCES